MIAQAAVLARYGDKDDKTPLELQLYWRCQRYGVLPEAGGLFDQPAGLMGRMDAVANTYDIVKDYRRAMKQRKNIEWANENPKRFEFITDLIKRGVI